MIFESSQRAGHRWLVLILKFQSERLCDQVTIILVSIPHQKDTNKKLISQCIEGDTPAQTPSIEKAHKPGKKQGSAV
jgi:hypothetical protein